MFRNDYVILDSVSLFVIFPGYLDVYCYVSL